MKIYVITANMCTNKHFNHNCVSLLASLHTLPWKTGKTDNTPVLWEDVQKLGYKFEYQLSNRTGSFTPPSKIMAAPA